MATRNRSRFGRFSQGGFGPSPNPHTNLMLADVALRTGTYLFRRSVQKGILGTRYDKRKARQIVKGRSLGESMLGFLVARAAVKSVPSAILVGGGLLAKTLYDRAHARESEIEGELEMEEMAHDGEGEEGWITESAD